MTTRTGWTRGLIRAVALLVCAAGVATSRAGSAGYHRIKTIKLGGDEGWDYITFDPAARRLYVSRATHVVVLDAANGTVVGDIPDTPGVHGVALAPELNRGFTSNGHAATVTIFDTKTLKVLGTAPAGKNPDAIIYDPATSQVFAFNGGSDSTTVISAADGKVAGTLDLGGGPEFAAADGNGLVFNNLEDQSKLVKINSKKLLVDEHWPLAPCEAPSSMAMDRPNRRIFIGCRSKVMAVVDADSGKVITTVPIGDHVDASAFDPDSRLIFNSNGEGTISVVHEDSPDKYSVVQTVKTLPRAKTLALDLKTHQLFLSTVENGQFEVLVVGK